MWSNVPAAASLRGALATKQSRFSCRGAMDCFAALAMTADLSVLRPKDLPCFRRARDLAAGAPRAAGDLLDQLAVRRHLGSVREIERIFEPRAQMAAELGAALMQRPD